MRDAFCACAQRALSGLFGLTLILVTSVGIAPQSAAAVLRVNLNATNQPIDGSTWTNAFRTLTNALSAASAGDEIWVAAGTYNGGILMKSGVALYGGFDTTESERAARNPEKNETVIDGRGTVGGFFFTNTAQNDTRVDGFTFRNCVGTQGGAIRSQVGSPTIANNRFVNNLVTQFGGAIYLESSSAVITNNYFAYNGSDLLPAGGALFASNSTPRIENNTFSANRARDGGALVFGQSSGFIERNHFIANRAARDGGAVAYFNASPRTLYNRFSGNASGSRGGALAINGGGSSPTVFNNVLIRNQASTNPTGDPRGGGAVFIDTFSLPSFVNNTLVSNTAPVGGILCSNASVTLANNLIAFGSSGIGGAASLQLFNNNLFGNSGSNYVGLADATGVNGNIAADPQFAGDTGLGVVNVLPTSPNRDAGNVSYLPAGTLFDIDGQPRTQGSTVDIGAAESDGVTTTFLPPVVRVSSTGNDHNAGDSWTTAKKTIQSAIDRAARTGGEVWVQAGTYDANLQIRPFTFLYGGFNGTETNRNQRDWRTNVTVLDAKQETGAVLMTQLTLEETLEGFTIQNGLATAGAGVFTDSSVRILHNRFASNTVATTSPASAVRGGGAIYVAAGAPQILNNQFFRNLSFSGDRNQPAEGGAIKINDGTPLIANNLFRQNVVTNAAANGEARGAAIATLFRGSAQVINNTLLQNTATVANNAASPDQGTLYIGNTNAPSLLGNNLVAYNSSGVFASGAPGRLPTLNNNLVFANIRTNYERLPDPTGTAGNLSVSPRLTGPYGDPHLQAGSPAIDAGDTNLVQAGWTDLDGRPRLQGGRVDIGADEFDGTVYPVEDRIFYVRMDGDNAKDGRSWENARRTLDSALLDAGLEGGEVWVKAGQYTNRFRAEVFTYVYGGFNGTETNRADRNWAANPTVLDGNISTTPGTLVLGPAVISTIGLDGYGVISGFIIQNGAGRQGGGIFAHGSPRISDNIIRSNIVSNVTGFVASGGGIFSQGGEPLILNNLLLANSAPSTGGQNGRGGAIYLDSPAGALPRLYNNTILNNVATNGGSAIYLNTNAAALLANNLIAYNYSGIAAASAGQSGQIELRNNSVFGNITNELVNVTLGASNILENPRLVSAAQGNFRLRADSPCLDAADGSVPLSPFDIYGQPRVAHDGLDIGAAEFNGPLVADFDIQLTQPVQGSAFFAPAAFPVAAEVTGGTQTPAFVEFSANGTVVATATSPPYTSFASGLLFDEYQIVATAVSASGSVKTSAPTTVSVLLPPGNIAPTVAFTSPTNTQSFSVDGPTTVRTVFNFSKPSGRILSWTLLNGATKLAENLNVPIGQNSATVNVPNLGFGAYTFTAIVQSSVGDKATNTVSFSVTQRTPVTAPALLMPVLQTDGSIRLEMTLPTAGAIYRLETSTNLTAWTLISTANGGGANLVTNIPGTNDLQHFRGTGAYP
jgi:hypothetical protein